MLKIRVIPCLLLLAEGLVKTTKFDRPQYVGDPINAVRIFNEKEVDELVFLDIAATRDGREPNYELVRNIASEAFMPLAYGGGINSVDQVKRLCSIGIEKVLINSAAITDIGLIEKAASVVGSQSIVVSIDVKKGLFGGHTVYACSGSVNTRLNPISHAQRVEAAGAGEILLTSIDRDGTGTGYDLDLIKQVAAAVSIPVIACGGAGSIDDFVRAKSHGASAVAAGSLFVFHGKHRAVLITYPEYSVLERVLGQ